MGTFFLKGEYPSREKLLSGLTLDQITTVPKGMSHSIFEEFWHLTTWQDVVVSNDESKFELWKKATDFLQHKQEDLKDWKELVNNFHKGVKKILEYCSTPGNLENLEKEIEPGLTIADSLGCLPVHNAAHFGKILAIRQVLAHGHP